MNDALIKRGRDTSNVNAQRKGHVRTYQEGSPDIGKPKGKASGETKIINTVIFTVRSIEYVPFKRPTKEIVCKLA